MEAWAVAETVPGAGSGNWAETVRTGAMAGALAWTGAESGVGAAGSCRTDAGTNSGGEEDARR